MIYVILGPTASGKSHAAEILFNQLNNPVLINADAFQIYQDMNIGTAKIGKDDPLYPHYKLLDIITPDKTFSVKDYQTLCRNEIDEALKNNRDVILVGGTGLYVRATLYDYDFPETKDYDSSVYDELDNTELHDILKSLDPNEAAKIHPNNRKRVIRAIELIKSSGETKSEIIQKQEHKIIYPDVKIFNINPPRDELYEKINKRVDKMFEEGLIDECQNLLDKYSLSLTSKQAIGYCEVIDFIYNKLTLDEAKSIIKQRSRNYAKRQVTFFKHQFDAIEIKEPGEIIKYLG